MSLKKKLDRYRKHLKATSPSKDTLDFIGDKQKNGENKSEEQLNKKETQFNSRLLDVCQQLGAQPLFYEDQFIFTKETHYPLSHQHGKVFFSELDEAVSLWHNQKIHHPLSTYDRSPSQLLFFDTETTGLGSGVGHMIFLLGTARYTLDGVFVKQYFLPGPGHEVALYHHFLNDVGEMKNLVTFNGKAFDWPKVKTRHTLIRQLVPNLPAFGHYDLLHASRRLWKNTLTPTSLNNIEENILSVPRSNDVPGHMAPFLYFQFQKSPQSALIDGIFKHNEKDILTLITLYIHLTKLITNPTMATLEERVAIAKWFGYLKQDDIAIELFEDLIDGDVRISAKRHLIFLYKRTKNYTRAIELIHSLLEHDDYIDLALLIEAAKIYEHQKKDYDYALYFANKAYTYLEQQKLKGYIINDEQNDIFKRIQRLKYKAKK